MNFDLSRMTDERLRRMYEALSFSQIDTKGAALMEALRQEMSQRKAGGAK